VREALAGPLVGECNAVDLRSRLQEIITH
jgi:hypothetical protein